MTIKINTFLLRRGVVFRCLGAFEDDDVTHVEGEVNPVRDLEIISEELRLKDMQYLAKNIVSSAMATEMDV